MQRCRQIGWVFRGDAGSVPLRVGLIQPVERIHLNAIHPDFPMQVRAGGSARPADNPDHLTGFHHITHLDEDL